MLRRLSRRRLAVFVGGFVLLWIAAWLLALARGWSATTPYWAAAKILVWMLYPLLFWRAPLAAQLAFVGLRVRDLPRGLLQGVAATALWVALSLAVAPLRGQRLTPPPLPADALYVSLLTPLCEEWLFRGYLLPGTLALGVRFWPANALTSLLFLGVHLVGWAFAGGLAANARSLYPLTILVVSLLLGYTRVRSGSLLASILLHAGNNTLSAFLR